MCAIFGAFLVLFTSQIVLNKQKALLMNGSIKKMSMAFISGLIGIAFGLLAKGVSQTKSTLMTTPLMLMTSILGLVINLILGYDKITVVKAIGICIAVSGCIGMIFVTGTTSLYFLLINSCSSAICVFIWRKLTREYKVSPTVVATWALFAGSVGLGIAYIFMPQWYKKPHNFHANVTGMTHLIGAWFMMSVSFGCTYGILAYASSKYSLSVPAIYSSAKPFITALIGILKARIEEDEGFFGSISCLFLIFIGMVMIVQGRKAERSKRNKKAMESQIRPPRLSIQNIVEIGNKPLEKAPTTKNIWE